MQQAPPRTPSSRSMIAGGTLAVVVAALGGWLLAVPTSWRGGPPQAPWLTVLGVGLLACSLLVLLALVRRSQQAHRYTVGIVTFGVAALAAVLAYGLRVVADPGAVGTATSYSKGQGLFLLGVVPVAFGSAYAATRELWHRSRDGHREHTSRALLRVGAAVLVAGAVSLVVLGLVVMSQDNPRLAGRTAGAAPPSSTLGP